MWETSLPPINGPMSLYQQLLNLISDYKKHHLFDITFYLSQKHKIGPFGLNFVATV
jgi:hypothetical protein